MRHIDWQDRTPLYEFAEGVVRSLHERGFVAYFAGGCVRDALMGNQPHDYDVATDATHEQVTEIFGVRHTLQIGVAFGVVCVHGRVQGKRYDVEVATFRTDGNYSDGRRPDQVRFASPFEDAQRRDFTINGMFFDPLEKTLHDFVGGETDLKNQVIRAIGEPESRIGEDKLRMLRAVRFAARFHFRLDDRTAKAIHDRAHEITVVSGERIAVEMKKLLETNQPGYGLSQIHELRLLAHLLPEVDDAWTKSRVVKEKSIELIERLKERGSFASRIAALILGVDADSSDVPSLVAAIQSRWKLSNQETETIAFAVVHHVALLTTHERRWSEIQPILIRNEMPDCLALADALAWRDTLDRKGLDRCLEFLTWPEERRNPTPLLTGSDLMRHGLKPGPQFSKLLQAVRDLQLDGVLLSQEDALKWLEDHPQT